MQLGDIHISCVSVCETIAEESRKISHLCKDTVVKLQSMQNSRTKINIYTRLEIYWFGDSKLCSGEQLYNCIWLQARGPNVMEFQVAVFLTLIIIGVLDLSHPDYYWPVSFFSLSLIIIGVKSAKLSFSWAFDRRRPQLSTFVTMTISCRGPGTPK